MRIETKKLKDGYRATLTLPGFGPIGQSLREPSRDRAVVGCLRLAQSIGAITQAEREHYLIHGYFEDRA